MKAQEDCVKKRVRSRATGSRKYARCNAWQHKQHRYSADTSVNTSVNTITDNPPIMQLFNCVRFSFTLSTFTSKYDAVTYNFDNCEKSCR